MAAPIPFRDVSPRPVARAATPLRVLHVVPAIAARYGGPSVATLALCRALAAEHVSAMVATTDADGPVRLKVPLDQDVEMNGVRVVFFRRRASESYKWSPGLAAWLKGHVSGFDIVHVHAVFSHASLAAGRACRDRGIPYIVRPLGTLDPWSLAHHAHRKRALMRLGARRLLTGAAAVHYTTADEQRLAERAVPDLPRGVVAPLGVDESLVTAPIGPAPVDAPYVLALARLDPKKGIDLLIEAFHDLADVRQIRDWRLVIAGDGDPAYVARLHVRADEGPSADRITFTGWVGGSTKATWLRHAALYALASHQENFGQSVAEAMACGVPVVVSPGVNLAPDIERHGAGWVAPRDRADLAAVLRDAMINAAERRRRGAAAGRLAAAYRWPQVAQHVRAMYDRILERRTSNDERRTSNVEPRT